ncbi:hypothetical protein QYF36_011757 [Acer negundo]|nr:hypothetical protein QYF36_011757 [Acer negundo]
MDIICGDMIKICVGLRDGDQDAVFGRVEDGGLWCLRRPFDLTGEREKKRHSTGGKLSQNVSNKVSGRVNSVVET